MRKFLILKHSEAEMMHADLGSRVQYSIVRIKGDYSVSAFIAPKTHPFEPNQYVITNEQAKEIIEFLINQEESSS